MNGYRRQDGKFGIRNLFLIVYTSGCARETAFEIAHAFDPGQGVEVIGCDGCLSNELMERKLLSFLIHPNVGAALIVNYGCEGISAGSLAGSVRRSGRPVGVIRILETGGRLPAVEKGRQFAEQHLPCLTEAQRTSFDISELVIGCECGGSDYTSGLAANLLTGKLNDYLISRGGTVLFEEMYEAIGLKEYLLSRCADSRARYEIAVTYDKYLEHARRLGQFAISPGNIRGGLSTIEEKSMGAVIKTGTSAIAGVLKLCQHPPYPGLWYVDMLSDDESGCGFCVSEDASSTLLYGTCGAQLCILTSGRGHVVNNPVLPTLKLTGNRQTYLTLSEDMDFDAGELLTGDTKLSTVLENLKELLWQTIDGRPTKGEAAGHREAVLNYERQYPLGGQGGCI